MARARAEERDRISRTERDGAQRRPQRRAETHRAVWRELEREEETQSAKSRTSVRRNVIIAYEGRGHVGTARARLRTALKARESESVTCQDVATRVERVGRGSECTRGIQRASDALKRVEKRILVELPLWLLIEPESRSVTQMHQD